MLKYIFVALLAPLTVFGQSELNETHTAIFFSADSDKSSRTETLQKHGFQNTTELSEFHYKSMVFVPKNSVDLEALKQEQSVEYISPIHSNSKKQFVTYKPNFFV
ncbi:MAG: hypothetical protein ACPGU4_04580, partial [Flavobacteriales bacterium]